MQEEKWVDAAGHQHYMVSSYGRVWSNRRRMILRVQMQYNGYVRAWLGRDQHPLVHRLVLTSFVGTDPSKPWANHRNGVRSDNRLDNLEWTTASENILHKIQVLGQGRLNTHPRTHLSIADVRDIRKEIQSGTKRRLLAECYGISLSTVHAIASHQNWKVL